MRSHLPREFFSKREPLHVTIKLAPGRPNLRRKDVFRALKKAVGRAQLQGLRIVHYALLANHAHLIVEARDRKALARQMQALGISLAKRLHTLTGKLGRALRERYHVSILRTPTQVKRALTYVLTNEYKHLGQTGRVDLDEYSTAHRITDETWAQLLGRAWHSIVGFPPGIGTEEEVRLTQALVPDAASTWLLRTGWQRAK